jgi:hypothetical protein
MTKPHKMRYRKLQKKTWWNIETILNEKLKTVPKKWHTTDQCRLISAYYYFTTLSPMICHFSLPSVCSVRVCVYVCTNMYVCEENPRLTRNIIRLLFDSVSIRIPTRIIRDYFIFMANHNFKVSPPTRCLFAANAICKDTDILTMIILLLLIFYNLAYT